MLPTKPLLHLWFTWLLGALCMSTLLLLCRDWEGSCYQCLLGVALARRLLGSLLNLVRHMNMTAMSTSWNSCEILHVPYRLSLEFTGTDVVTVQVFLYQTVVIILGEFLSTNCPCCCMCMLFMRLDQRWPIFSQHTKTGDCWLFTHTFFIKQQHVYCNMFLDARDRFWQLLSSFTLWNIIPDRLNMSRSIFCLHTKHASYLLVFLQDGYMNFWLWHSVLLM